MIRKNFINKTVFLGNTAGPMPRQIAFKRFRLARSMKRVTRYLGNQGIEFTKDLFVFRRPAPVFLKSGILKTDHCEAARFSAQAIACSSVSKDIMFFPCFTFSIAVSSRSRLAGELQRYSVSSCSRTCTLGVKVISALPAGTSGGTSIVNLRLAGISTVCVTVIRQI